MNIYRVLMTPQGAVTSLPDSQTLFGALCWAIKDLYGETQLESLLNNFSNHPQRFVVSSAFPEGVLPAPNVAWNTTSQMEKLLNENPHLPKSAVFSRVKQLKRVRFFSESLFENFMLNKVTPSQIVADLLSDKKAEFMVSYSVLHYKNEKFEEWSGLKVRGLRNRINRLTGTTGGEGQLFYDERLYLPPNKDLVFYLKTNDCSYFEPLLRYLSDGAIGKDKSAGLNHYKLSLDGEQTFVQHQRAGVLISKYIPQLDEVDFAQSHYQLISGSYKVESRDAFFGEDIIKREVVCLCEGSQLWLKQHKDIYGQLPIVKEINGRAVRHNGLGFII